MTTLFDYAEQYPNAPGWQRTDTSHAAAQDMKPKAGALQAIVLDVLRKHGGKNMEEIADLAGIGRHSIQPRCSELRAKGLIKDSGERSVLQSGRKGIVWRIV